MKNNKLIADFIGLNINKGVQADYMEHELKYDTSWDWLMPVVVKCFNVSENMKSYFLHKLCSALLEINIDSLYKAVIEFIKEYNES